MLEREIYRVVDVNANRAREGLRAIEEVMRFILEEPQFTARLKEIRHNITDALKGFSTKELLSARNSRGDVGRELSQPGEGRRDNSQGIIRANMVRSQEALRALEEFSKVIDSRIGERFKALRFQVYSLEKEVGESLSGKGKGEVTCLRATHRQVREWKLYVILDKELSGGRDQVEVVKAIAAGGGTAIQWRDKEGKTREAIKIVSQLRNCQELGNLNIVINDRVDVVLATGADGVHLGQDDLPLSQARKLLGEKLIGVSIHSEEEALQAEREGADYISLGPIFPTQTKKEAGSPLGVKKIGEVKKAVGIPIIAIGGIDRNNIDEVIAAGADVVAVASAVLKEKDIAAAAKELLSNFKEDCDDSDKRS